MEQNQNQNPNPMNQNMNENPVETDVEVTSQEPEYEYEVDYRDPRNYQIVIAIKCMGAQNKYQVFDNIPPIEAEPDYVKGDPWAAIRPLDINEPAPDPYDVQIFHLVRAVSSLYARKFNNFEIANHIADQILYALYGYTASDTEAEESAEQATEL